MATNYNITMKQFNGTDYDNLYPAANLSNSIGSIQANQINGQIPASQISGLSTTPNVSNATGTLAVSHGGTGRTSLTSGYYLVGNGTGAVTLQSPSQLQSSLGLDDYAKIQTGSYTGTGTYGSSNPNSLTLNFSTQFFMVQDLDRMAFGRILIGNNTSGTNIFLYRASRTLNISVGEVSVDYTTTQLTWYASSSSGEELELENGSLSYKDSRAQIIQMNSNNSVYRYVCIGK